ncbi:hypothetical protein A2U01_0044778 [Trifolium medium]|uniref:Uncharacterized protein n=1 Tax=Trifolium medium TaxID=97028 RepID=A0A392QI82_9FABA|nr:hypothetical protein [Trifolium medium]
MCRSSKVGGHTEGSGPGWGLICQIAQLTQQAVDSAAQLEQRNIDIQQLTNQIQVWMSNLFVNGDPRGDCPVWGSEDGEFFPMGTRMEEKFPPREVWRCG